MSQSIGVYSVVAIAAAAMTTTLDKVVSAIEAFYAPTTAAEVRRESGKFLEKFQNTVSEWRRVGTATHCNNVPFWLAPRLKRGTFQ